MTRVPRGLDESLPHVRCPSCRSSLVPAARSPDDVDRWSCTGCGQRWPIRFGIPDLRAPGVADPYLTLDDDLRAAERLSERARTGSFEDTLASYYEANEKVTPDQARRFIAGALAAEDRARAVLSAWRALFGDSDAIGPGGVRILDAGCGTGPLLVAASGPDVRLVGVDVGLRWLVLAAARLRDRGVSATLVCAGADHLPLADAAIDMVAAESLYENVPDTGAATADAARVLRPGGWLCLTTPNRWSIGPDPHVGLPLGGWMPEAVVAAWASRRGMVPPRRHLLSARELRAILSQLPFSTVRLGAPPIAEAQVHGASPLIRAGVNAYRVAAGSGVGRALLLAIGPSLLAVARRDDSSGVSAH